MNNGPTINLLRALFVIFGAFLGSEIGYYFWDAPRLGICGGVLFGLVVVLADRLLKGFTLRMFSCATFGLLLGFIASRLLLGSELLKHNKPDVQWLVGLGVHATFSYLGMMLAVRSNRDEFALIVPFVRFRAEQEPETPILVDSNIILDGRLTEIAATGFLRGSFVIPSFVLDELQVLADSADSAKREKGRLALARMQEMRRNPAMNLTIHEGSIDTFGAVDTKLVQLAKILNARLLSNDGNLCSIARLQGISALNLNELNKALRPALTVGDEVELSLTREGRDAHQAVGYLGDGTMIVVNHARPLLGKVTTVTVSSVLQTSAGRLFFAEIKAAA